TTKDGRQIHVAITRTHLLNANGRVIGSAAIVRDITKRKELERKLIAAQTLAAVGEIASRIAHENKKPPPGVSGAIHAIEDSFPANDERCSIVREIDKEIVRLDSTVNDLLSFARPRRPQLAPVNLAQVIDHALAVLREEPALRPVQIVRRFGRGELVVQ